MRRAAQILGVLVLALMLWTGTSARAAEGYTPITVASETVGHFAGDKDEVPSDQHQGAPHHHSICGEYQLAAWDSPPAGTIEPSRPALRLPLSHDGLLGREPDGQLRPPIA